MGGILESIIEGMAPGGGLGGGLGSVLEGLNRSGQQTNTGSVINDITRHAQRQGGYTTSQAPEDMSIEEMERQLGVGRKSSQRQSYPQQETHTQQETYQQNYPQQTGIPGLDGYLPGQETQQPTAQKQGGGLLGGGLSSIIKVIGFGALAAFVLKKFR